MSEDKIAEIRDRHSKRTGIDHNGSYRLDGYSYPGTLTQSQRDLETALAEIETLRAENKRLRAKIKWLIEDDERLHYVLYRIANPPPFADCPVEMAQNATRGEHLRREAFDGIRRALEDKP